MTPVSIIELRELPVDLEGNVHQPGAVAPETSEQPETTVVNAPELAAVKDEPCTFGRHDDTRRLLQCLHMLFVEIAFELQMLLWSAGRELGDVQH